MRTVLTVDIGGTKCSVAITDDDGVHNLQTWPTSGSVENLDRVRAYYDASVAAGGSAAGAIGVCFGGPVDSRSSTVKRSVHVDGWQGFDFSAWAHDEFGLPVGVDNDANVGALAEFHHGNHDANDLLYVTVSTGIGAGVMSDGRLIRGATNEAGELGHTRVRDDPRVCSCGRTGCLERLCSGYWLEQDYGRPAAELLAHDDFLADFSDTFARGLATGVLLYNPLVIVLGGGVSRVGDRLTTALASRLTDELASWSHLVPRLAVSTFDLDGVHLGAKELTRDLF